MRPGKLKPLLFTTTIRSPERLKEFLRVFYEYDGKELNDEIIEYVATHLIKLGLYRPTNISKDVAKVWKSGLELSVYQAKEVFNNNPQSHKERGFERGWPSRFDTWYKLAKELGLVWYWPGEKIAFSESGKLLLDQNNPQNEALVFANAFSKYNRDNPFKSVLNHNKPLILLLETIKYLNQDKEFNGAGISRSEIPLLLCWPNDDSESLYKLIKKIRKVHGFKPSNEVILGHCSEIIDEIKRNDNSILIDYPDEFIRKMRLTGLISVRGAGRFIDINSKEKVAIDYILSKYKKIELATQVDQKTFFNFIGKIDHELTIRLSVVTTTARSTRSDLEKWSKEYTWNNVSEELINLSNKRKSTDPVLMFIEQPLRLEFLTALAIIKQLPEVEVKPNYITDDEGLPISFAGGGLPDIECIEDSNGVLVEVTLLQGAQQHIRESFSVRRHLEDYIQKDTKAYSILLSPHTHIDTKRYAEFSKIKDDIDVRPVEIPHFVSSLNNSTSLSVLSKQ